jgi:hypothetical protein
MNFAFCQSSESSLENLLWQPDLLPTPRPPVPNTSPYFRSFAMAGCSTSVLRSYKSLQPSAPPPSLDERNDLNKPSHVNTRNDCPNSPSARHISRRHCGDPLAERFASDPHGAERAGQLALADAKKMQRRRFPPVVLQHQPLPPQVKFHPPPPRAAPARRPRHGRQGAVQKPFDLLRRPHVDRLAQPPRGHVWRRQTPPPVLTVVHDGL